MSAIAAEKNFATVSSIERIATQLNRSYLELENRIGELQQELAQTDQERQREHQAKEKLAEKLDLVLGLMPVAVILLDGRGVVAQANAIAENLLGAGLAGQRWINVIRQYFAPTFTDGHEVLLNNGRLLSLATQSLKDEPGQIIVLTDQTETRRLQETLNHHRKLSDMGRMTASLAHQIRTPLSAATLYADHLASPQLTEERRLKYAGKIRSRLAQLGKQVQDMLIFSRGGVVLDEFPDSANLAARLQQQLEDVCEQQQASCVVETESLSGRVRCNPALLISAFGNLVDNAVQACLAQNIKPVLHLSCRVVNRGWLEIALTDNGPGVAPALRNKILEPFFTTKSTGTGLGLAVVCAIVSNHGGQFQIENSPAGGAIARISLPVAQQN